MWLAEGDVTVVDATDDADLTKWMTSHTVGGTKTRKMKSVEDIQKKIIEQI